MDGLSANIAILDGDGTILAVNRAWREFAVACGLPRGTDFVGQNYVDLCEQSYEGSPAAEGLRKLLKGARREFYLEYPCHGKDVERWFGMRATPLDDAAPAEIIVAHENITDRKIAERSLRQAQVELESRVKERTEELAQANRELFAQMEERRVNDAILRESNDRLQLAASAMDG